MKVNSRFIVMAVGFIVLMAFVTPPVFAEWPDKKPITVVIQYKAGGGSDVMARAFTAEMEGPLETVINPVNRPGALGSLANDFVWQKPSDGYWAVASGNFSKSVRVMGYSELSPWKDWQYFKAASSIQGFAVKADSPFKTMQDFIEAARKEPGNIRFPIPVSAVSGRKGFPFWKKKPRSR